MNDLKGTLLRALASRFGVKGAIDEDTKLFSSGLIDSLSVMDLVCFIEDEIGCSIPPTEITLENFDSINSILSLAGKLTSAGDSR